MPSVTEEEVPRSLSAACVRAILLLLLLTFGSAGGEVVFGPVVQNNGNSCEASREAVDVVFPSTFHSLKVSVYRHCKQEMVDFYELLLTPLNHLLHSAM